MQGSGGNWQERKVTVMNKDGLHMRPATKFVERAMAFSAEVRVAKGDREFDGKSIFDMIEFAALMVSEAAGEGKDFLIRARGPDAGKALDDLERLVLNHFDSKPEK